MIVAEKRRFGDRRTRIICATMTIMLERRAQVEIEAARLGLRVVWCDMAPSMVLGDDVALVSIRASFRDVADYLRRVGTISD